MKVLTPEQISKLTVNQRQVYYTIQQHRLDSTWKLINEWYSHHTSGVGLKRKQQMHKDYVKVGGLCKASSRSRLLK
jgi:hypothetical protein